MIGLPRVLELGFGLIGLVFVLWIVPALLMQSWACAPAATLVMRIAVEPVAASSRLVAEAAAVMLFLILAALIGYLTPDEGQQQGKHRPQTRDTETWKLNVSA